MIKVINLKVLQRMLSRLKVTRVKTCTDGAKALSFLKSIRDSKRLPNLILTDLNMPVCDGFELMRRLKEVGLYDMPPIVVACTGKLVLFSLFCFVLMPSLGLLCI